MFEWPSPIRSASTRPVADAVARRGTPRAARAPRAAAARARRRPRAVSTTSIAAGILRRGPGLHEEPALAPVAVAHQLHAHAGRHVAAVGRHEPHVELAQVDARRPAPPPGARPRSGGPPRARAGASRGGAAPARRAGRASRRRSFAVQTAPSVPITARAPLASAASSIGLQDRPGGRLSHHPSGLICRARPSSDRPPPVAGATRSSGRKALVPSERIRVLIADDHPLYRTGLVDTVKRRPELELVGQAEDGAAALEEIRSLEPRRVRARREDARARRRGGAEDARARGPRRARGVRVRLLRQRRGLRRARQRRVRLPLEGLDRRRDLRRARGGLPGPHHARHGRAGGGGPGDPPPQRRPGAAAHAARGRDPAA